MLTRARMDPPFRQAGRSGERDFYPLRDGSHGGGLNSVTLVDTGQKLSAQFRQGKARAEIAEIEAASAILGAPRCRRYSRSRRR